MVGRGFGDLAAAGGELGEVGAGALDGEAELCCVLGLAAADEDRREAVEVVEERADQGVAAAGKVAIRPYLSDGPTSWPGASLPRWSRPGARFQQQACSDIWCISRLCRDPG